MTILSVADEIRRELADNSVSTPSICFWLVNNVGSLNNLIGTNFLISSDSINLTPDLSQEEKSIYKKLYNIYFYDKKIREFLGAASNEIVLEVSSDGGTVRTVNKNEISKSYIQMKKLEQETLDKLISSYSSNDFKPLQVCGDERLTESSYAQYNRS